MQNFRAENLIVELGAHFETEKQQCNEHIMKVRGQSSFEESGKNKKPTNPIYNALNCLLI